MEHAASKKVGDLLREWRARRRLSQLDLALEAEISTRHLSFLETGRAQPSRAMVLHLAEQLEIPLRERNLLLTAAGFAPFFPERPLDDQSLAFARQTIDLILTGHEPNPALAVDRHWTMIAANKSVQPLLTAVDASLLEPPVNVLRLSLHPKGLAPQIVNYAQWRTYLLERLRHEIEMTADEFLLKLMEELKNYPIPKSLTDSRQEDYFAHSPIAVPLRLLTEEGELSFISTTTVFGTPLQVTLAELAIESFFPADVQTAEIMNRIRQNSE